MYKRLRDSLFDPKKVPSYISDKIIYPILMIIFFSIILIIPTVYSLLTFELPYETKSELREEFYGEDLPYVIIDGKLTCTDSSKNDVKSYENFQIAFLDTKTSVYSPVIRFKEESVSIEYATLELEIADYTDLEKLVNFKFSDLSTGSEEAWNALFSSINQIYEMHKTKVTIFYSIYMLIGNIGMLFLVGLLLALGSSIRLHGLIKFNATLKMDIYYLTPFVVTALISDLVNLKFIYYIGIIISFIYCSIGQTEIFKKIYSHHTEG